MERLEYVKFMEVYEGVRISNYPMAEESYIFTDKGSDYLKVLITNENKTLIFVDDNFPAPRRAFSSDIPITSISEFENDLKRMNIKIPKRLPQFKDLEI